jgi:hypothetical protein
MISSPGSYPRLLEEVGDISVSILIPTIGIREAEDLPTVLAFMRFADGRSNLGDLETYLMDRSNDILSRLISPTSRRSRGY